MTTKFIPSSINNPCPVCQRTKDGDCRIVEGGNFVLCHEKQVNENVPGYFFYRHSNEGAGWGLWLKDKPQKINAEFRHAIEEHFVYQSRDGKPLARVVRNDRNFYQQHWDGSQWKSKLPDEIRQRIPVYRYPEIQKAIKDGQIIFFVEGEGTADALWDLGIAATTTIGGCKGYSNYGDYSHDLNNAILVLCPDRDKAGIAYLEAVAADHPQAKWCKVFPDSPFWSNLPASSGLDAVDWIQDGATKDDFLNNIVDHWKPAEKQQETEPAPVYDEVLDIVEGLDAEYEDQNRLDWELKNRAYDEGWQKRGFNAQYLYRQMQARRDNEGELVLENAHDIMEQMGDGREWFIQGIIPKGSVIMLYAEGGTGKTSLIYHIMRHVGSGAAWSGYKVNPAKCCMIQADEPKQDTADKLQTARFFDLPRDQNPDFCTQWRFTQIRQLRRAIAHNGYGLIGIDSYTAANAGTGIELTKSNAGDPLYLLRNIASELNITFIVVHHMNKGGGMRDSTTLNDNVSEVWKLYRPPSDDPAADKLEKNQLVLDITKSRSGLRGRYILEQDARDFSWLHRGLLDRNMLMESVLAIISEAVREQGRPVTPKIVAERLSVEYADAEATLEHARRIGLVNSQWVLYERKETNILGRFRVYAPLDFNLYPIDQETPAKQEMVSVSADDDVEWI